MKELWAEITRINMENEESKPLSMSLFTPTFDFS
jgi:hypothetical protein